jgi:hypothetical protein
MPDRPVLPCWSPAIPQTGTGTPNISASVMPNSAELSYTSGSTEDGIWRTSRSSSIPTIIVDIEEHGPGRVGRIGCVNPATSQTPEQKAVDGAEGKRSLFGFFARSRNIFKDPLDLGCREIRVNQQACFGGDELAMSPLSQTRCNTPRFFDPARQWPGRPVLLLRGPRGLWSPSGW